MKEITGDGERKPTEAFSGLQSHYLFAAKFGRPGKGNDKGNVEGLVGYARRNFMVPVPRAASWEDLNAQLREECLKQSRAEIVGTHRNHCRAIRAGSGEVTAASAGAVGSVREANHARQFAGAGAV